MSPTTLVGAQRTLADYAAAFTVGRSPCTRWDPITCGVRCSISRLALLHSAGIGLTASPDAPDRSDAQQDHGDAQEQQQPHERLEQPHEQRCEKSALSGAGSRAGSATTKGEEGKPETFMIAATPVVDSGWFDPQSP